MQTLKPSRGRRLIDFAQYGFSGGINIQDAPSEIGDKDIFSGTNLYLDTTGSLNGRLGMQLNGPSISRAGPGTGIYRFYQELVKGVPAYNAVTVMQVGGNLYNADTGENYGSVGGPGAQSMSVARVQDPNYNGGTDILVICTGAGLSPYVFDGTSVFPYATSGTTVTGARWCYALNGILWLGGLPLQPTTIAGSIAGQPSMLPGYAIFEFSSPVVGFTALGTGLQSTLVCGLTSGVGLMSGFTPNSFIEQEIVTADKTQRDGVSSGGAMIAVDGYPYIPGNYAIYRYDGATFTEVSRKVRPWVVCDPTKPEFPMNGNRALSWSMIWNRRIYFWYASNALVPNTALVFDLTTGAWTIYAGVTLGAACAIDAPNDTQPIKLMVADATIGQQHQFDVYNSADPNSPFAVSDNGVPVACSMASKFYRIGTPGVPKRVMRVQPALYVLKATAGAVSADADSPSNATDLVTMDVSAQMATAVTSAAEPQFVQPRVDINLQGEGFSLGFATPAGQTTPVAPWRLTGFTGRISESPRT